jgi:hypothetical protein
MSNDSLIVEQLKKAVRNTAWAKVRYLSDFMQCVLIVMTEKDIDDDKKCSIIDAVDVVGDQFKKSISVIFLTDQQWVSMKKITNIVDKAIECGAVL